jgi:cytochrome c-type biogenesis protein
MRETPDLLIALLAGFLSFASPCVLPLIPSYLSFLTGASLREIEEGRNRMLLRSLAFVLGFSFVFVALGAALSSSTYFLGGMSKALSVAAGALVIVLGLNMIFDFPKVLNFEKRLLPTSRPRGLPGAFLFGMAFAAGWSPCVGPILASILFLAGKKGNFGQGILLLSAYSAGLAFPFLAFGLFLGKLRPFLEFLKKHARAVKIASGSLLVLIGASILFGKLSAANSLLARAGFALKGLAVGKPELARIAFAVAWGALALLFLILSLVSEKRASGIAAFAAFLAFTALCLLQSFGIFSTARVFADWLLFQGI